MYSVDVPFLRDATAAVVLGLLAVGCGGESGGPVLPPDTAVPAPGGSARVQPGHHTVTGKVPTVPGSSPSIVILEPLAPGDLPPPAEPQVMDQIGRAFVPRLLLVQVGQVVEFRNSDGEPHNVRLVETGTHTAVLDVDMPMGNVHRYALERPGAYGVYCNLHPDMYADLLAVPTPYATMADAQGDFVLPDVPAGAYMLTVRYRGKQLQREVDIDAQRTEFIVDDAC